MIFMNYLLSFIHLLKWLFYSAPRPSTVCVVNTFAVPQDNKRNWETQTMNSEENQSIIEAANMTEIASSPEPNTLPASIETTELPVTIIATPELEAEQPILLESQVLENTISPSSGWVTVQLQQQVTLANLHELHHELQQLLGKRVQLSGSQVQRVDTAALQLLVAFMHCSDVSVCWIDHSPALRQSAHLLGLSTLLNLPE